MEEYKSRSDIKMVDQAITKGWITDDETRIALRQQLEKIALDPATSDRNRNNAIKTLGSLERLHFAEREQKLRERIAEGQVDVSVLRIVDTIQSEIGIRSEPMALGLPDDDLSK